MKKIFIMTVVFILTVAEVCFAIGKNDFNLGGVYPNMSYDTVIKMYGQPTSIPGGYTQLVSNVIMYGDNVEIGFSGKKVRYIVTTANNGWKTPSGIHVGMSINEVIQICGNDYKTRTRSQNDIHDWMKQSGKPYYEYKWHGTKYSWSQVADFYSYEPGDTKLVLSVVENGGKVTGIEISQITPEY